MLGSHVYSLYRIAKELGVDPNLILATSHGRRSIDTIALYDPSKANWDCTYSCSACETDTVVTDISKSDVSYIEGRLPQEYGADAIEIPGARDLLATLEESGANWGVVTSGTRALVDGWLDILRLTHPRVLVVAEDVELGKPDPRCYLLGCSRLGLQDSSSSIVVLEDAPSGIKAGKAAGFKVLALTTTHTLEQLQNAGADWIVEDLRSVSVRGIEGGRVQLEIRNAFQ